MASKALPSPEVLRQLLRYEPGTGKLFWQPRPEALFRRYSSSRAWNAKFQGRDAFTHTTPLGYKQGAIFNRLYLAHRVIWAIQTGSWPTCEIDHKDCNGANNAWSNLRLASRSENTRNTRRRSDNKTGVKGVNWDRARAKWKARIVVDGKEIGLGRFSCFGIAVTVARKAREEMHGKFARH